MASLKKTAPAALALDTRTGWPADLRLLIDRYPREVWAGHANLGAMAQFWLQRHAMFREIGASLEAATAAFRDGTASAADFRAFFPPRLQFFLQQLNAHHQIEDLHYFPVFQAAEARLAHGFDVLEADHHLIHGQIDATVEAANAFLRMPVNDAAAQAAGDRYGETSGGLLRLLTRHLDDEEDLIIPLILDRGEGPLGVGWARCPERRAQLADWIGRQAKRRPSRHTAQHFSRPADFAVANRQKPPNVIKPPADRSRERRDREGPGWVGCDDDGLAAGRAERLLSRTARTLAFETCQHSFMMNTVKMSRSRRI